MQRRNFLRNSGLSLGAGTLFSSLEPLIRRNTDDAPSISSGSSWEDVRAQFKLTPDYVHMALMLFAPHPKPVRDAIEKHRRGFDENPVDYLHDNWFPAEDAIREAASRYLGAATNEIVLTDSTTMGIGLIHNGFKFKEGDEIITSTHDHYVLFKALEFASERTGAVIVRNPMYADPFHATVDEMVTAIQKQITPRTRMVSITHVHSCTGIKTPIKAIADMLAEANHNRAEANRIYLAVDGVHGFGIEKENLPDLGCDYFSAGTHKWLFGPRGTGFVYAKKDAWDMIAPTIPAFEQTPYLQYLGVQPRGPMSFASAVTPGGFHSYEHRWALREAFDFMYTIGKERIESRTYELNKMTKEGLANISHVKLHTPMSPDVSCGINCFEVDGMEPQEVVKKLHEKRVIASDSPYRLSFPRFTPGILNTEEDVHRSLSALESIRI